MKASDYKAFKECMRTSDENDPVWYAGYLFLNLTARQSKEVTDILLSRGFPVEVNGWGKRVVKTPIGMGIIVD